MAEHLIPLADQTSVVQGGEECPLRFLGWSHGYECDYCDCRGRRYRGILVIGGWWLGKTRKNAVDKSTEDAKAAADARLAAEASRLRLILPP